MGINKGLADHEPLGADDVAAVQICGGQSRDGRFEVDASGFELAAQKRNQPDVLFDHRKEPLSSVLSGIAQRVDNLNHPAQVDTRDVVACQGR